jgi:hypothetical protein
VRSADTDDQAEQIALATLTWSSRREVEPGCQASASVNLGLPGEAPPAIASHRPIRRQPGRRLDTAPRPRPAGGRAPALATNTAQGSWSATRPAARPARGAATGLRWPRASTLSSSRRGQVEHQAGQVQLQPRQVKQQSRTALASSAQDRECRAPLRSRTPCGLPAGERSLDDGAKASYNRNMVILS